MYPRLKILRESLGMTQEEFGKSINVAKSTYNNYETGIRDPKSDFWIAVAQKYGVTIDYLMGFSDNPHKILDNTKNPTSKSETISKELSSEEQAHIKKYRLLDRYGKEAVDSVLSVEYRRCAETGESGKRSMIQAAARSGNVSEIEEIYPDELPDSDIIP